MTTQYLDEADQLADRIAVIDHGRVVAEGTADELKASVGTASLQLRGVVAIYLGNGHGQFANDPGGDRWREWASRLAQRFRSSFWVADGRYPALALDRDDRPVDALTSNIGHLLGTGLLDGHVHVLEL